MGISDPPFLTVKQMSSLIRHAFPSLFLSPLLAEVGYSRFEDFSFPPGIEGTDFP